MLNWKLKEKVFELKYTWKISRNASTSKNLFFVESGDDQFSGFGEASPNIRYEETPDRLHEEFKKFLLLKPENIRDIHSLSSLLNELNPCNSLRFAIESAYIHYLCFKENKSIHDFLGIQKPGKIFTSYTIPIMDAGDVNKFIDQYQLKRFKSLKIKINQEGLDLVNEVERNYSGPLRIDANEAWLDVESLILFMEKLKGKNIEFIEQPLPYNFNDEYIHLKKHSQFPIMGDESITHHPDMEKLSQQFDAINMKLMKAGGYLHGIDILKQAKSLGLKTMIGCMVETTLGISSGMHLCTLADYVDLDGAFLIDNDPYYLMKESDGELFLTT